MKIKFLFLISAFACTHASMAQTRKGWSVETEKHIVYFAPQLELAGDDSIRLVSDSSSLIFSIDKINRVSFHRDGRSGWPGTFIGTVGGAVLSILVFSNNDNNNLESSEKVVGSTFIGLIGATVGGAAGGLLYRKRTIEDVAVLTGLYYPQKQMLVKDLYERRVKQERPVH